MKANNYMEIATRINETIKRINALDNNWNDDSYTYDELMKEERSVMRTTKTIAEDLGFSIEWGDFKNIHTANHLLRSMGEYVNYTLEAIENVRRHFTPDVRFKGDARLVKNY